MPSTLTNIPPELQLSIFGFLEDLDDALYLSQTCKTLRSLFAHSKKIIERQIIVTSHTYEYDLCLSKLNEMKEDLAQNYSTSRNQLPTDQRPRAEVLLKCLNSKWGHEPLVEETINDIALRWQQLTYLRELYLDDLLSKEFDLFRARFASESLSRDTRAAIVEPGFIKSSSTMSRLENSRGFDPNFKARFHKSLCLHSIAIITRSIAFVSRDQLRSSSNYEPDEYTNGDVTEIVAQTVVDLLNIRRLRICYKVVELNLGSQLDCLEVFDFLYLFLIRKLLPIEQLYSWTDKDANDWPYQRESFESKLERWYSFILHAGFFLQPTDLAHLIKERAWFPSANYPQDKSLYMRVRGMFDLGGLGAMDWFTGFDRENMVGNLQSGHEMTRCRDSALWDPPCWWDQVRLRCGQPFRAGFQSRYMSELGNYELAAPKVVAS